MRVSLEVPKELVREITNIPELLEKEVKLLLATKLAELNKISTGKAAEWLNMSKPRFLLEMSRYRVSALPLNEEELKEDVLNVAESIR